MSQDKKREPVHPGYILRRLSECLPSDVEEFVVPTINALFAFSGQFLFKEDLEAGRIRFSGIVAYKQLASVCRCAVRTARWRVKQLRDRHQLLTWKISQHGIYFTASYSLVGNGLLNSTSAESVRDVYGKATGSVRENIEVGNGTSEVGNGLPPLSFNCQNLDKNRIEELLDKSKTETGETPATPVRTSDSKAVKPKTTGKGSSVSPVSSPTPTPVPAHPSRCSCGERSYSKWERRCQECFIKDTMSDILTPERAAKMIAEGLTVDEL